MVKRYLYNQWGNYSLYLLPSIYRFHCWGASGGYLELNGSRGAYISGLIQLKEGRRIFIYVGEKGVVRGNKETFNGGGKSSYTINYAVKDAYSSSGGGGTDIRLIDGEWDNFESLKSRIIVAGGGGGETNFITQSVSRPGLGGYAGIYEAEPANFSERSDLYDQPEAFPPTTGGGQKEGGKSGGRRAGNDGSFGKGGNGEMLNDYAHSSGAGGGYFGGGGAGITRHRLGCGAGGSSFISGVEGFAAMSFESTTNNYIFKGSVHYSGLYFTNPVLHSGKDFFLSPDGFMERGHSGDGAVLIERLTSILSCNCKSKLYLNYTFLLIIFLKH